MKRTTRILSLILAVVMLISVMGIQAFAEGSPAYEQEGFTYVAFGDSYSRGMGCSDTWEEDTELDYGWYEHQSRCVPGAYPTLVAQALEGCVYESANNYLDDPDCTFWPLIQNGQRIAGVLDGLGIDDGYYDEEFYHQPTRGHNRRYNKFVRYFGNPDSSMGPNGETWGEYGTVYDARELIAKADLITLQLGMADCLNRPVYAAAEEYLGGDLNFDDADTETILAFVAAVVENMYEGYEYFLNAYPLLLDYLTETNEDGEIVIMTAANPAFGINLSEEYLIPIGTAFSGITIAMNEHIRDWADEYNLIFVDISNVETSATEYDWTLIDDIMDGKAEVGTHPSPNGHKQIARMILSAYENRHKPATRDIVVDLGRLDRVSYVMVNGVLVKNYKVEDCTLTIPNKSKLANNLTVAVIEKNGKVAARTYQLVYHRGEGYSAYRIYSTNDVVKVVTSPVTNLLNLGGKVASKLTSTVTSLFKK